MTEINDQSGGGLPNPRSGLQPSGYFDAVTRHSVLFIQGAGDMWAPDGSGVLAKYLQDSLGSDYDVIAPEMPGADTDPRYLPWRKKIEEELRGIDGPVVLVGHSLGGSMLLKFLAEGPPPTSIAGLFLVSVPHWSPEGWEAEYALPDGFASRLPAAPTFLYHSRDDPHVPFEHLAFYKKHLPNATSRTIDGTEHSFLNGLPELVDDIRALDLYR